MRRLIVTADDVGLAAGITRGAFAAHDEGIVTACSVTANGEAVAEAAAGLRLRPRLAAGIHFVLTGERPLSPPAEVRSLVGRDGALLPDAAAFTWRYLRGGIDFDELTVELERQAQSLVERGVALGHADGHQHLHLLPRVLPIVLEIARAAGVSRLRVVHEPDPGGLTPRGLGLRVLNRCGAAARRRLPADMVAPAQTIGMRDAGRLDQATLVRALAAADRAAPLVELVCHPGLDEEALARRYRWGYRWARETAALCAPAARDAVAEHGFTLFG